MVTSLVPMVIKMVPMVIPTAIQMGQVVQDGDLVER